MNYYFICCKARKNGNIEALQCLSFIFRGFGVICLSKEIGFNLAGTRQKGIDGKQDGFEFGLETGRGKNYKSVGKDRQ